MTAGMQMPPNATKCHHATWQGSYTHQLCTARTLEILPFL
jgi:hypothetical protein